MEAESGPIAERPTEPVAAVALSEGRLTELVTEAVLEEPLALEVNGRQAAVLMRLPGQEKELAAGYLVSEGLVGSFADILTIHHCGRGLPEPISAPGEESRNRVRALVRPESLRLDVPAEVTRLIRAGCGGVDVAEADLQLPTLPEGPRVAVDVVLGLPRAMLEGQALRREVGGVHAAALCDAEGRIVVVCEDIGRHNAADKAIGHCLLRGVPLADKVLLSSGRLSYEMAAKAIRAGIGVLASVSAPTALAVQIAERHNLTLIGYVRGNRLTVYAHPERLVVP